MPRKLLLGSLFVLVTSVARAQVPIEDLARPPATARHYVIQSPAGKHGDSWSWVTPDGTRMARESLNLRGLVSELDSSGKSGKDGMIQQLEIRGVTPNGDAAETFSINGGKATWKSIVDAGSVDYKTPAFYYSFGGPIDMTAWSVDALLASPTKSLPLLPGGMARAEKLTTLTIGEGAKKKTITAWAIVGVSSSPLPVWADQNDKFFAVDFSSFGWLPEEYAGEHQRLTEAQSRALAQRAPALVKSLLETPAGAVAFRKVQLFDADARQFLADQTVIVEQGRISAVGPSKSVKIPKGAQVFDGKGKTLLPGMWDCHMHVGDDFTGVQELSMGVTSVRDPGNDDNLTIDRRERAAKGLLLMPNVYPSSLIDGEGPYAAQVANVATGQQEMIDWIDKAKANGFSGVKFYGTLDKTWIPAAVAEAHKLGLHVHGHLPHGMRTLEAIDAGYDEITHINWIVMQGLPDSVVNESNGILRFEGPGRYAKALDLDSPPMTTLVSTMAAKGIYSDPTMSVFESLYVPENGDLSPSYSAFVGTLPPSDERYFKLGGFQVPEDLTRADYRESWAKMVELLGRMHKAGVPVVAGTDGTGIELVRELEIYQEAGFTPAEAIAAATIVPATLVGQDKNTGSIKVGKVADLFLVEGDPSKQLADLRQTRTVMLGGKLLDADALRAAAGFSGRPKPVK